MTYEASEDSREAVAGAIQNNGGGRPPNHCLWTATLCWTTGE